MAGVASITPGTEGLALLRTMYDAEIRVYPNEKGVIGPDIPRAQVEKAGRTMTLRRIPAVTIRSLATTAQSDRVNLTYESASTESANASAVIRYSAVGIPRGLTDALLNADASGVRDGYRRSIQGGLEEAEDIVFGNLFLNISTTKGPGNFDKAALLDLKQTLRINSKGHFENGGMIHLKYHPTQIKYVENIAELMNAELRGDGENPNVKGFFVKGLGMTFAETANVPFSTGNYWNCAFLNTAFIKAYNQERTVLDPQLDGLTVLYHGYVDVAGAEAFDADAIIQKTA